MRDAATRLGPRSASLRCCIVAFLHCCAASQIRMGAAPPPSDRRSRRQRPRRRRRRCIPRRVIRGRLGHVSPQPLGPVVGRMHGAEPMHALCCRSLALPHGSGRGATSCIDAARCAAWQHGVLRGSCNMGCCIATSFLPATQQRPRPRRAADGCARAGAGGRTAQCTGGRRGRCRGRGRRRRVCLWAVRLAAAAPPVARAPPCAHRAAVGEWRRVAHVTVCAVHWATGPSALAVLLVGAGCCTCTGTTARRRRHPSDTTLSGSRASSARRRANVARVAHPRRYRGNTAAFRRIDSYWHRSIRPQRTAACTACQAYAPVRPVLSECSGLHARYMRRQH